MEAAATRRSVRGSSAVMFIICMEIFISTEVTRLLNLRRKLIALLILLFANTTIFRRFSISFFFFSSFRAIIRHRKSANIGALIY